MAINEIAESVMAFNTNYKDTGLFGVYAEAKVSDFRFMVPTCLEKLMLPFLSHVYRDVEEVLLILNYSSISLFFFFSWKFAFTQTICFT